MVSLSVVLVTCVTMIGSGCLAGYLWSFPFKGMSQNRGFQNFIFYFKEMKFQDPLFWDIPALFNCGFMPHSSPGTSSDIHLCECWKKGYQWGLRMPGKFIHVDKGISHFCCNLARYNNLETQSSWWLGFQRLPWTLPQSWRLRTPRSNMHALNPLITIGHPG